MKYVVKNSKGEYADGGREWVQSQREAFVFDRPSDCGSYADARVWARAHAKTFQDVRAVRLVSK